MSVRAPKMRFRRRALPGYRDTKEPTGGELNQPIACYTSSRAPSEEGGFIRTLTCYHTPFSKFEPAPERFNGGENADYTATHVFTIRWDGRLVVQVGNYILCNKRFYKVSFTKTWGKMKDWLTIYANEHFVEGTDETMVISPDKAAPVTVEPGTHNSGFDIV